MFILVLISTNGRFTEQWKTNYANGNTYEHYRMQQWKASEDIAALHEWRPLSEKEIVSLDSDKQKNHSKNKRITSNR